MAWPASELAFESKSAACELTSTSRIGLSFLSCGALKKIAEVALFILGFCNCGGFGDTGAAALNHIRDLREFGVEACAHGAKNRDGGDADQGDQDEVLDQALTALFAMFHRASGLEGFCDCNKVVRFRLPFRRLRVGSLSVPGEEGRTRDD
jgi:hypothetical protein